MNWNVNVFGSCGEKQQSSIFFLTVLVQVNKLVLVQVNELECAYVWQLW
jgi:hypothetical protein